MKIGELGVQSILTDEVLRNESVKETFSSLGRMVCSAFEESILEHKQLMTEDVFTEFERDTISRWEFLVVIAIAMGGRGRPSKDFLNICLCFFILI